MPNARDRLVRDLHDLADAKRAEADSIDLIAGHIDDGGSIERAREKAVENQLWELVKVFPSLSEGDE